MSTPLRPAAKAAATAGTRFHQDRAKALPLTVNTEPEGGHNIGSPQSGAL